jgi:hypothetical protein
MSPAGLAEGVSVVATGVVSCFDSSGLRRQILADNVQTVKSP